MKVTHTWTINLPRGRSLILGGSAKLMGILNLTPDSFYAYSRIENETDLLIRAEEMLNSGADILDVGAESTRPGATPLPENEELNRLIPALTALRKSFPDAVISVDTYKGNVALAAADAGADIINDISGFGLDNSMLKCAVKTGLPYVLSHIYGSPETMLDIPDPEDIISDLHEYFKSKLRTLEQAGLNKDRIIIDPGLGFGKGMNSNLRILNKIDSLHIFGCPILVGHSRKRFTGAVIGGKDSDARLHSTTAISALIENNVEIIRVHDVAANYQALITARSLRNI